MKLLALLLSLLLLATPAWAETNALQAGRDHLAQAGYTIPDEAFTRYCESHEAYLDILRNWEDAPSLYADAMERMNDPAACAASLFTFAALGDYDYETDVWTPWFRYAYAFDVEIFNVGQMYTLFLQGVDTIAHDAAITDVTEDLSGMTVEMDFSAQLPTDGTRSVSFLCNGHPYTVTLDSYGDWFNEEMITFMNRVFEQEGCQGRLYTLDVDLQTVLLVYGTQQKAENLSAYFGFSPMW